MGAVPAEPRRVGVFGGSFDPPHIGHLTVAGDVADALELDEVWWVPAARSPFKVEDTLTPAEIRLEMVRAAIADDPRFVVRDDEIRRGGVSYTVDTIRAFRDEEPDTEFFLILGADQADRFGEWREAEEILRLATLAVVGRDGTEGAGIDSEVGTFERVSVRRVDVSSSDVRERVRRGGDVSDCLPPAVLNAIRHHALYTPPSSAAAGDLV